MTWQPYLADDYIDQDGVEVLCRDLAEHAPEWVDLREIGTSGQGRPILMLVIGHQDGDDTRPGVWIDAGTHASEFTSVSAAMFTISRWVKQLVDGDEALTDWFRTHIAVIVPVLSPDGYDAMHRGHPFVRSSLRPAREEAARSGFEPRDIDGDGVVRWMRFKHPAGSMIVDPEVPMFMRARTLDDDPSDAYFLCSEGEFIAWDGVSWVSAPREFGVDLNRNFSGSWAPMSMFGMDSGAYALSEPEARAVTDAFASFSHLGAALTYHTYSGCILTQPYRQDSQLSDADIKLMKALADDLVAGSEYKVYKVCPEFMYDAKRPIGGVWADTIATVFGVPGYTVEYWNPYGYAGLEIEAPAAFFVNPDPDKIRTLVQRFCEDGAYEPWRAFDHPQLGPVEIGGLDYLRTVRNPPTHLLAKECEVGHAMADRLRRAIPEVRASLEAEVLADGVTRVSLTLENVGFLPTSALQRGADISAAPECLARVSVGEGVTLVDAPAERPFDHLQGWGNLRTTMASHAVYSALHASAHRARISWVVTGHGSLDLTWHAGRAGTGALTLEV